MTPIAISYFVLGLSGLVWPLAILLLRRRVQGAQWLLVVTMVLVALSIIVYSCFFNTFLKGEYLLVMLFMLLSLASPPAALLAVTALTRPQGVGRMARMAVLPSVAVMGVLVASVAIGGADMYGLWIARGADGWAASFFGGSWRYNLIVAAHYYLFGLSLVAEVVAVAVYTVVHLHRYRTMMAEYYTTDVVSRRDLRPVYVAVLLCCMTIAVGYVAYPFNRPRPLGAAVAFSLIEGVSLFLIGMSAWRASHGAELIGEGMRRAHVHGDLAAVARTLIRVVEQERNYLDPDLTVFRLAELMQVPEDEVVDAVHRVHGTPFGEYIDSLRIEHATRLLMDEGQHYSIDDPESLARLAHRCGYLSVDAFSMAFENVLQISLKQWFIGGGLGLVRGSE